MNLTRLSQSGYSLLELLAATAIGTFVALSMGTMVAQNIRASEQARISLEYMNQVNELNTFMRSPVINCQSTFAAVNYTGAPVSVPPGLPMAMGATMNAAGGESTMTVGAKLPGS